MEDHAESSGSSASKLKNNHSFKARSCVFFHPILGESRYYNIIHIIYIILQ